MCSTVNQLYIYTCTYLCIRASLVAQIVRSLPAVRETWVWFLGREDLLEKEMATHSSILAWKIPWTEEPGGATVHGVTKNQTRLSDFIFTFTLCMYIFGLMYLKYYFRNKYFKINIEVSVLPLVKCNHYFNFSFSWTLLYSLVLCCI